MKYKLVIFDWDGTIMDSVGRIVSCVKTVQQASGLELSSEQAIKDIIGLSLDKALLTLTPDLNSQQLATMVEAYRVEYVENDLTPTPIFTAFEFLLMALRQQGTLIAIATGKGRSGLDRVIAQSGFGHYFCDTVCATEANSKPDPQMIELLLARLGIDQDQAVMIGDSSLDMAMAQHAGVDAIGVTYGAHTRQYLAQHQPVAIVDRPEELVTHLVI
ncbi:MAG: HAD-IA family hydrolase [Gammaproteobacteria bacterium]|nr:HAD-IA family hydrolase [Gammaproteobacteria bacterium]